MMLGKRSRPPIKRTTSLSEITFDLNGEVTDPFNSTNNNNNNNNNTCHTQIISAAAGDYVGPDSRFLTASILSPRVNGRRHSADFMETPQFLKACGFCNRRLIPGRDIYMYRGDTAFCSLECRQQQINKDEKKCSLASKKSSARATAATPSNNVGRSTKAETTVTAAL
ncbi:hypothetical protein ACFE04_025677 [Oxalis oulophora]